MKPSSSILLRRSCCLGNSLLGFSDTRTALWIGGGNLTNQGKVTYFRETGTPAGIWTKLHQSPSKLTGRIWCLYICMKIVYSSFVKGTLPRLVDLKLALQLCFALQARACLFCSWKQLGVEIHKKPALCEMQKEYVIFRDSLSFVCFSLLLPPLYDEGFFWLETRNLFKVSECYFCLGGESLNAEAKFSPISQPATGCKLHSLLRACLALISSLESCFSLANSCQHLPTECPAWY